MKYSYIALSLLIVSCSGSTPPSDSARSAGLVAHAKYHNDQRVVGRAYTPSEENTARDIGNFTQNRWDTYQSGNKGIALNQAQTALNEAHAKINQSFPKDKKPFQTNESLR
jgi:hypothetical protein